MRMAGFRMASIVPGGGLYGKNQLPDSATNSGITEISFDLTSHLKYVQSPLK